MNGTTTYTCRLNRINRRGVADVDIQPYLRKGVCRLYPLSAVVDRKLTPSAIPYSPRLDLVVFLRFLPY